VGSATLGKRKAFRGNHDANEGQTEVKKEIDSITKAYLFRGVFYLLLLIAVCDVLFALAPSAQFACRRGAKMAILAA
jgi:hypothetical protein